MDAQRVDDWNEELAKVFEIGEKNLEILTLAHAWCKHAERDRSHMGVGIPEQMTGLPISGGSLRCDYAKAPPTMASMHLDQSALEFYEANCVGCTFRDPGGSPPDLGTWAAERRRVIDEAQAEAERQRVVREGERLARSQQRRIRLAGVSAARAEVLDLLDRIDAEDRDQPAEVDLLALAQHDPGVFPDAVLDEMRLTAAAHPRPILADAVLTVHEQRGSTDAIVLPIAEELFGRGISTEQVGAILGRAATHTDAEKIRRAAWLAGGSGDDPFSGDEPAHPAALIRMYDLDPAVAVEVMSDLVSADEPWLRARACRAAINLIGARPAVASDLVDPLLTGLAKPDSSKYAGEPHAAHEAKQALSSALAASPEATDEALQRRWVGSDIRLRKLILGCYEIRDPGSAAESTVRSAVSHLTEALFDESSEIVMQASEGLASMTRSIDKSGSTSLDNAMIDVSIDLVVRLATSIDAIEESLVVPSPTEPGLEMLTRMNLVMSLDASLRSVRDAAGRLGRHDPPGFVDQAERAWTASTGSVRARAALLEALEECLEAQRGLAVGLPFLSKVLDEGSLQERFVAVQVLSRVTRYSGGSLPAAVGEQILKCLLERPLTAVTLDLVRFITVPEDRLLEVLNALLVVVHRPLSDRTNVHVAADALAIARRLAVGTEYEAEILRIAFETIDKMHTTDAVEVLRAAPEDHPAWVPSAVRALHHDEDAAFRGHRDDDRKRLLLRVLDHAGEARAHADDLAMIGVEKIAAGDQRDAWGVADVLAAMGEHEKAAIVCMISHASLPDVPEQQGRRRHVKLLELGHRLEAAVQTGDMKQMEATADEIKTLQSDQPSA